MRAGHAELGAVGARCVACGADTGIDGVVYTCEKCGGTLDLRFDYLALRKIKLKDRRPLVDTLSPLHSHSPSRWGMGATPLVRAPRLGAELGLGDLLLKDDRAQLSGSLKDRASHMVLRRALELKMDTVAAASTGNAGASLSAVAAQLGLKAVVFAPRKAPPAKLRQIQVCGARLVLVDGNYDRAYELCLEACRERGWYSRNTGHNPYCGEGKKSVALEIMVRLAPRPPDIIVVPVGDGCILGAVHKGLADMYHLGFIRKMPRLMAVQAQGSAAVADAWREGREIRAVEAKTLADSLAVDMPRDGIKALRALRETKGFAVTVSDAEILAGLRDLAQLTGMFAEPAAAATIAGLRKAAGEGLVRRNERIVALITGHGLKDQDAALPLLEEAPVIAELKDLS